MNGERRHFSADTLLHARSVLLTLDTTNPDIGPAVGNAASWLEIMAVNHPGTTLVTPEVTLYSIRAANQVIRKGGLPGMDKKTGKQIRKALREKRTEMKRAQKSAPDIQDPEKLRHDLIEIALTMLSTAPDEISNAAAAGVLIGAVMSKRLLPLSQSTSSEE